MEYNRNLRTNPVDSSGPFQQLTHTITHSVFMHTEFYIYMMSSFLVVSVQSICGLYSFRAQNKAARLSPVDPGSSRGVTALYPSRGYTHPVACAIEVSHTRIIWQTKLSFNLKKNMFWSFSQYSRSVFFIFFSGTRAPQGRRRWHSPAPMLRVGQGSTSTT